MKTIIKVVAAIVVIIGLFIGGAALLLVKAVNPNDYKNQISQFVKDKTDRDLKIQGNISWSFFPLFGVKIHDISLSNTDNFGDADFAKVGEIDIKILPLPLFFGKTTISEIVLRDSQLNLIKDQNGENNWQDLVDKINAPSDKDAKTTETSAPFKISNLLIKNATVNFDNQEMNKTIQVSNLNLESENVNTDGDQFYVNADANFHSSIPNLNGHTSLSGNATINLAKKVYELQSLQIIGDVNGADLHSAIPFAATANINTDLENQTLNFDNVTLRIANMIATGKVQATNITYAPQVIGNLTAANFDPKPLLKAFGFINGESANAFNNASFKLAMQTTSKFLKITDMELDLDDSKISGVASYSHFTDKYVMFNLDANKIDLDRYVASIANSPDKVTANKVTAKNTLAVNNATTKPNNADNTIFSILRATKLNGELGINDLKYNKMHFGKIKTQITGEFGNINLHPLSFNCYHGYVNSSVNIDVRKNVPQYVVNATLTNIAVQPLSKDVAKADKISGIAALQANLNMHGKDATALIQSLNGHGKITLDKGIYHGIDLRYQVDRARTILGLVKGQKINIRPESNPPQTDFGKITAAFTLQNGVLNTNNLLVKSDYFSANGSGTADLNSQQLNIKLEATNDRKDFYLPVKITNTFSDPKITPEMAIVTKNLLQPKVEDKVKTEVKKQIDKLSDKSSLIKSLKLNANLGKLLGK